VDDLHTAGVLSPDDGAEAVKMMSVVPSFFLMVMFAIEGMIMLLVQK
jgi:Flp pilus assembly protein TadG